MNYIQLIFFFFSFGFSVSQAQVESDTIQIRRFISHTYYFNGKQLGLKKLIKVLESNPEAHLEILEAKKGHAVSSTLAFFGGFFAGYGLSTYDSDEGINLAAVGLGVVMMGIAIPIGGKANKRTKKAVEIFNNGITQTGRREFNWEIKASRSGIGIGATF